MLTTVLLVLAAFAAIFLIAAALQPTTFRVARSLAIGATPAVLFPHLNDLKKTHAWSPFLQADPAAKITFEGPAAGVGASSTWSGNNQLGEGRQTIVESQANERVVSRLDFKRPFESVCMAEFTLLPDGARTLVTWSMSGKHNVMSRAMTVLGLHDRILGGYFVKGLFALQGLVERGPSA